MKKHLKNFDDTIINTKKDKAIGVRMPPDIYQEIKFLSQEHLCSFNSMQNFLLKSALKKTKIETMLFRLYKKMLAIEKKINSNN